MSLFFQIELDYLVMVPCSNLQPHQKTFICYFHSNAVIHRDLTGVIFVFQDFPDSACILRVAVVTSFDWKDNTSQSVSYMPNFILGSGT